MKKVIVFSIITAFILTGCWDSIETEDLGVITLIGVGITKENDIKVIVQEKPHEKQTAGVSSSQTAFLLYGESGGTISEALEKMAANQHHRLYLAHNKVIILDEELINLKGIKPVIDFYERNPEVRPNTRVLISPRGQLDKILSHDPGISVDTGTILEETINNIRRNSFSAVNNLANVIEKLNITGGELFTAGISIAPKNSPIESTKAGKNETKKFDVKKAVVFKGGRLAGWLNDEEFMGLIWINGTAKGGITKIPYDNGVVSLRIIRKKTEIRPVVSNGKMRVDININIKSNILESQGDFNLMDRNIIDDLEKLQCEKVRREISSAIAKSRSLESDFLCLGSYFNMEYPKLWKQIKNNWYSYYQDVDVNVYVNSTIKEIGKIYKPLKK